MVELIATIKSINEGFIPKTINIEEQDENCDLNVLAKEGYTGEVNIAVSNSFGFGGHNCSMVDKKFTE